MSALKFVFLVARAGCGYGCSPLVAAGVARGSTVRGRPARRWGGVFFVVGYRRELTRRTDADLGSGGSGGYGRRPKQSRLLGKRVEYHSRGAGQPAVGADRREEAPAQSGVVYPNSPQALRCLTADGGRWQ